MAEGTHTHLHVGVCTTIIKSDETKDFPLPEDWAELDKEQRAEWRQEQEDEMRGRADVEAEVSDGVLVVRASTNKVRSTATREVALPEDWDDMEADERSEWIEEQEEQEGRDMVEVYSRFV